MNRLQPEELAQFSRRYRFIGGKLRKVSIQTTSRGIRVAVTLVCQKSLKELSGVAETVRLKLVLEGVEEFRFQKRLNMPAGKIPDLKLASFQGILFLNLDAYPLSPGEVPGPHDFRASDAYAAGKSLYWQELPRKADRS
jgi:hypothetical protein